MSQVFPRTRTNVHLGQDRRRHYEDTAINDNATHTTKNLKGWLLRVVFFPTCHLQMSSLAYITYIVRLSKRTMAGNGRNGRGNAMLEWRDFYRKGFTGVYRKGFTNGLLFVSSWFSDTIRGFVEGL